MSAENGAFEFSAISSNANQIAADMMRKHLDGKLYVPAKTSEWVDAIGNSIIEQMRTVSPNFKFIVSTVIVQKMGAGMHSSSTSFWDAKTDGMITTKYENDSLTCLCTVIGCSL
jgi:dynein light chain Tctex-type 1